MIARQPVPHDIAVRGLAAFSAGDPAEACVAHLILALFACHLGVSKMADLHVAQAREIVATRLNHHQAIRRGQGGRIARIVTQADGQSATLLLPIVDGVLVAPCVDVETILPSIRRHRGCEPTVTLHDIEIDQVTIHLQPAGLTDALRDLAGAPLAKIAQIINVILDQNVIPSASPGAPLDVADAFFALARDFSGLNYPHHAQLCLEKASAQLDVYANSAREKSHRLVSNGLVQTIATLVDRMDVSVS